MLGTDREKTNIAVMIILSLQNPKYEIVQVPFCCAPQQFLICLLEVTQDHKSYSDHLNGNSLPNPKRSRALLLCAQDGCNVF